VALRITLRAASLGGASDLDQDLTNQLLSILAFQGFSIIVL